MDCFKRFYGHEIVNIEELIETNKKRFIKLEYYGIKNMIENEFIRYGIEIVKKEYIDEEVIQETSNVENITTDETYMEKIISTLKRNKVTPVGLVDIISDLRE